MGAYVAVELASEDGKQFRQNQRSTSKRKWVTPHTLPKNVALVRNSQDFISKATYP